ncbi:uncharacterized protein LOC122647315 [Telopea speciosissima]|uniref:uncharacterized protein LOC122647315 n=1 Tax=Telopea speciosissima TaxID=54955 RepID=UPI001CC55BC4|nr:uncharacterized protein LOC122647315 [Telopea speciosissima]
MSASYLFLDCLVIKAMWQNIGLINFFSNHDIWPDILSAASISNTQGRDENLKASLFCSLVWFIWNAYWDLTFRQMPFNPRAIILRAIAHSREQMQLFNPQFRRDTRLIRWIPPSFPTIKFNVDGASRGNPGASGIGGVCRLHSASFIYAFSQGIGWNYALVAEALAVRTAMTIAIRRGFTNLTIESDN